MMEVQVDQFTYEVIEEMVVVRKYDKDGKSERRDFENKLSAFLWLNEHLAESEWCWIMYEKKGEKQNVDV